MALVICEGFRPVTAPGALGIRAPAEDRSGQRNGRLQPRNGPACAGAQKSGERNKPGRKPLRRHVFAQGNTSMKRYAYAWITLGFFLVSIGLHWLFGWYAFVNDATAHHQVPVFSEYLAEMCRDTYEKRK
jgi:hypothetical protein